MNRRTLLAGLPGLIAAPAVLRLGAHMPVRRVGVYGHWQKWTLGDQPPGTITVHLRGGYFDPATMRAADGRRSSSSELDRGLTGQPARA